MGEPLDLISSLRTLMRKSIVRNAMLIVGLGFICSAQQKAVLNVHLTDASGASISNAHVLLRANQRATSEDLIAASTGSDGGYSIQLQPGIYDVFISAPCLIPFASPLKVTAGENETLPVQMKLQGEMEPAYISDGCPTPDDFSTPIDFNLYSPPLPDYIPLRRLDGSGKPTVK